MYSLKISKELQREINYLHSKFPNSEWSGVLAFTFKKQKNKILFTPIGIYPMNVGTATSTSFSYKEKILDIYAYFNKKTKEPYILGSIHTHHNMNAFISGVDEEEIKNNTLVYNNYLFLVVDTNNTYVAKFARKKIIESSNSYYIGFDNEKEEITNTKNFSEIKINNVKIEYENENIDPNFIRIVDELKNDKIKPNELPPLNILDNITPEFLENTDKVIETTIHIDTYKDLTGTFKDEEVSNILEKINITKSDIESFYTKIFLLLIFIKDMEYFINNVFSNIINKKKYLSILNNYLKVTELDSINDLKQLKHNIKNIYYECSKRFDELYGNIPLIDLIELTINYINSILENNSKEKILNDRSVKLINFLSEQLKTLKPMLYEE